MSDATDPPVVVTVSAPYGAGGSEVGPSVAERLGVEFLDRAIPAAVAEKLALPLGEAMAADEQGPARLDRLLRPFAAVGLALAGAPATAELEERTVADATEQVIHELAASGGVILGRAGAVVLRDQPRALHVRLHGPASRRVAQAMRLEQVGRATAERRLEQADRARVAYVSHFYGVDPEDPALYHLVIDSTAVPLDAVADVIVLAARAVAAP
jgi:cytidylate kinase